MLVFSCSQGRVQERRRCERTRSVRVQEAEAGFVFGRRIACRCASSYFRLSLGRHTGTIFPSAKLKIPDRFAKSIPLILLNLFLNLLLLNFLVTWKFKYIFSYFIYSFILFIQFHFPMSFLIYNLLDKSRI